MESLNWGSQLGGRYGSFDVLWRRAVPACPAYISRSPENARATARRVHDYLLREHRLAHSQSISTSCDILRDHLVNQMDCVWDDLWDELVDE